MKNRLKKTMTIAFVVLLATGCNGSEITKDQANQRMTDIANYQEQNAENLYSKGIYLKLNSNTQLLSDKNYYEKTTNEIWIAENYFHKKSTTIKRNGQSDSEFKKEQEVYLGKIHKQYYYVDTVARKYYNFIKSTSKMNEVIDKAKSPYTWALSVERISELLEIFPDDNTFSDGNSGVLKSKGGGNLYIESNIYDEKHKCFSYETLIFDNYRFSSSRGEKKYEDKTFRRDISAKYHVNTRMPGIIGMKESQYPYFEF